MRETEHLKLNSEPTNSLKQLKTLCINSAVTSYLELKYRSPSITMGLLFSCSVISNSLRVYGLQHVRLPYFLEFAQTHIQ